MSETVFIIGAGVSKEAGAPLMNDFLDVADGLRKNPATRVPELDLVFRGRDALQSVLSKASIDLLNLESVFAAFEMAKLLRRLGLLSIEEIDALPGAMARLIQCTLETTITFPISGQQVRPPQPYDNLGAWLAKQKNKANWPRVSFITFNYDICLDYALFFHTLPVDYCLGSPLPRTVRLMKLHGSLNWSQCPTCKYIVPLQLDQFFRGKQSAYDANRVKIPISSGLGRVPHCGGSLSSQPFIAPPTWNKTQYHSQLESVWQAAAQELSDAENIVICGYSLPETDQFFRYLYALGTVGGSGLKRFWVVNPDPSVLVRFEMLCGPLAKSRFRFLPVTVQQALPEIQASLDASA
jgi:NAD-dependent SIR2 family protein deacetylase